MNAALMRQLRSLLARYGHGQVMEAISALGEPRSFEIPAAQVAPAHPMKHGAGRTTTRRKSVRELVEAANVDSDIRPVLERIGAAYVAKEILPEFWRVRRFLASEGLDTRKLRSRADALPKVVAVLAEKRRERLETLLNRWRKHAEQGDLAMMADAILGPGKTVAPTGDR